MLYYLRPKNDIAHRRWKVREAVSVAAAMSAITNARVSGSIGWIDAKVIPGLTLRSESKSIIVADVIQVNSDNTERQPYTEAY